MSNSISPTPTGSNESQVPTSSLNQRVVFGTHSVTNVTGENSSNTPSSFFRGILDCCTTKDSSSEEGSVSPKGISHTVSEFHADIPSSSKEQNLLLIDDYFNSLGIIDTYSQGESIETFPQLLDRLASKDQKKLAPMLMERYLKLPPQKQEVFKNRFREIYATLASEQKKLFKTVPRILKEELSTQETKKITYQSKIKKENPNMVILENFLTNLGKVEYYPSEEAIETFAPLLEKLAPEDQKKIVPILMEKYMTLSPEKQKVFKERFKEAYTHLNEDQKQLFATIPLSFKERTAPQNRKKITYQLGQEDQEF